jgi:hypothetical protein
MSPTDRLFRKQAGCVVWHFMPQCSQWPYTVYQAEASIALDSILCDECVARRQSEAA